jgi:hypothetical protein
MPSENKDKYLIWLALTETDYITMFIKTWFTFLATLREILPDCNRDIGDGGVIELYKENLFEGKKILETLDEEFMKNTLKAYDLGKNHALATNEFLKEYFKIFYTLDESYSQHFSFTYRKKETTLSLKIYKGVGRADLRLELKDDRKEFYSYFGEKIETGFNLLDDSIIKGRVFENNAMLIDKVIKTIEKKGEVIIGSKDGLDARGKAKRMGFLDSECLIDIKRKLLNELDLKQIFNLQPFNNIKNLDPSTLEIANKPGTGDEDITKWFVDFSYMLRNILFHFIIDPLDKNWQELFKYLYLALKYLSEKNIRYLDSLNHQEVNNDNCNL